MATIIAVNAIILFRDGASFLLGRSPGPEVLAELERAARSVPGVVNVRGLRAEFVGPDTVHVGLHIEVAPNITVDEGARIAAEVRAKVHEQTRPGYCFIETDPAQEPLAEDTAASAISSWKCGVAFPSGSERRREPRREQRELQRELLRRTGLPSAATRTGAVTKRTPAHAKTHHAMTPEADPARLSPGRR